MFSLLRTALLLIPGIGQLLTRQFAKGIDLILLLAFVLLPIVFETEHLTFLAAICKIVLPAIWVYNAINVFGSFYFSYLGPTRYRRLILVCTSLGLLAEAFLFGRTSVLEDLKSVAIAKSETVVPTEGQLATRTEPRSAEMTVPPIQSSAQTKQPSTTQTRPANQTKSQVADAEYVDQEPGTTTTPLQRFVRQNKLLDQASNKSYLVVDVAQQKMWLLKGEQVLKHYQVSTARAGTGNRQGSFQTPLGAHQIYSKIGKDAAKGAVFEGGIVTGKIEENLWNQEKQDPETSNDIVTTRIIRLTGIEKGKNKGGEVDTLMRRIYIHGTTREEAIGKPTSQGCVRMINDDIIELFDLVVPGGFVYIAERLSRE